ncbi:U-box domain-containing protein 27-like [Mercurialis annua]|uniref:U-box domain-containing protein 27-like n=1 Tax=Mercurialis annua TaxID=3986 RepID=UPI00216057C0|nr:U-box domain-containing protein 27-like [Mercurialis annua]
MVRDDLYITVPSLFRCPISLDVMKSPVSLSTGVTYDRVSIQRWLDQGNNTCPATMQILQTKDFVPNCTLQRLIQIWSDSAERHQTHHPRVDSVAVPSQDEIKCMVKEIEYSKDRSFFKELEKIMCFAEESDENRSFLAKLDGFVEMLVDFMGDSKEIDFVEQVIRVLDLILMHITQHHQLMSKKKHLDSLVLILRRGKSIQSRIGSVRIVESIANNAESKLIIGENDDLLLELVKSTGLKNDPTLIEASLSCLISISKAKRVKSKLVNLKTIPELRKIITAEVSDTNLVLNSTTEKALKLIETLVSCKEGRAEMCNDVACIEAVVQKLFKVSSKATEHAVTILWSLCYLFRDGKAREAVMKSNGLTKILLLMQSNCSPAVRQMATDLLKIFRVNSKCCLSSYDTKTTHIMPF